MPRGAEARLVRTPGEAAVRLCALCLALAATGVGAPAAWAQASLVPAHHPVYEWLHHQRVLGNVPAYMFEALPASRGEINELLARVRARALELGGDDRALLAGFEREFSPAALRAAAGERPLSGDEPHLFVHADSVVAAAVDGLAAVGVFRGVEPGATGAAALPELGLRGYVNAARREVGAHAEASRLLASGDVRAVRHRERYARSGEVVDDGGGGSWYVEASASGRYRALSADVGRGALRVGAGFGEPLVMSRDASGVEWVRVTLTTPRFVYMALHGGLDSPIDGGVIRRADGSETTLAASERRIALHRMEVRLHPRITMAFSEALIYSARPIDLAYLNPVNVLFFGELENEDRDNVLWVADATWRPVDGVEVYGTLLGDDLGGLRDLIPSGGDKPGRDRAFDGGVSVALSAGVDVSARYLRIEPFVYTHWQRLNAYEQHTFPLGNSIGPNADRWLVRARKWLPGRAMIAATFSRTRKGMNPVDGSGRVVENVGGDATLGTVLDPPLSLLERADVHVYREIALEGAFEPRRGVRVSASYLRRDVTRGWRIPELDLLTLGVSLGY